MWTVEAAKNAIAAQFRRAPHDEEHHQETEHEGGGARRPGSDDAQSGRTKMTEDERVVACDIEEHGYSHHRQGRVRLAQRRRVVAQDLKAEREGQAEGERNDELARGYRQF